MPIIGSVYGYSHYGENVYGWLKADFDVEPFLAISYDYGDLTVTWAIPEGDWTHMRLVRSMTGFPVHEEDGEILYEDMAGSIDPQIDDESLEPGVFVYYSLWAWVHVETPILAEDGTEILAEDGSTISMEGEPGTTTGVWRRAGNTQGIPLKDFGYRQRLLSLLPEFYIEKDQELATRKKPRGPLQRVIEMFGEEFDHIRGEYETLFHLRDINQISEGLLPLLAHEFDMEIEGELGATYSRRMLENAVYVYQHKGTKLGMRALVAATTGWDSDPYYDAGTNTVVVPLFPDRLNLVPNPSFENDLTGWTSDAGTAISRSTDYSRFGSASMRMDSNMESNAAIFTRPSTAYLDGVEHAVDVPRFTYGRNLLTRMQSEMDFATWTESGAGTTKEDMGSGVLRVYVNALHGGVFIPQSQTADEWYVFSFETRWIGGEAVTGGHIQDTINITREIRIDGGGWVGGDNIPLPTDGEWHFVEQRWQAQDNLSSTKGKYIQPGRGHSAPNATQDIRHAQMEHVDAASGAMPWTPGGPSAALVEEGTTNLLPSLATGWDLFAATLEQQSDRLIVTGAAPPEPTFTRASTAYLDGVEHLAGIPRYTPGDYFNQVLRDDPVAYWRLDETSGTMAVDSTGNGHTGSYEGDPVLGVPGVTRLNNFAVELDSNDQISVGNVIDPQVGSFSVEAWVNLVDPSITGQRIMRKDSSSENIGWALSIGDQSAGRVRFFFRDAYPISLDTPALINNNTWHHVVGIYDAVTGDREIWVDGALAAADVIDTGGFVENTVILDIGSGSFHGKIDEPAVYLYRMTDQISHHYKKATAAALLIEEETTNLLDALESQGQTWSAGANTTVDSETGGQEDPFGGMNAVTYLATAVIDSETIIRTNTGPSRVTGDPVAVQVWVRNNDTANNVQVVVTNHGEPSVSIASTEGWKLCTVAGLVGSDGNVIIQVRGVPNVQLNVTIAFAQYEDRSYPTSWQIGGTARAVDKIYTPAIIDCRVGTLEIDMYMRNDFDQWYAFDGRLGNPSYGVIIYYLGGSLRAWLNGGGTGAVIDPSEGWHRCAARWENGLIELFLDGVFVDSRASTSEDVLNPATIGTRYSYTDLINSSIDTIRVSSRVRTDAELFDYTAPLIADRDTTYLLDFAGSLEAESRVAKIESNADNGLPKTLSAGNDDPDRLPVLRGTEWADGAWGDQVFTDLGTHERAGFHLRGLAPGDVREVLYPQAEDKLYPTSWQVVGTARSPEKINVADIPLSPNSGTLEIDINLNDYNIGQSGRLFEIEGINNKSNGFTIMWMTDTLFWRAYVMDDSGNNTIQNIGDSNTVPSGQVHRFAVSLGLDESRWFVDGVLVATIPSSALPSEFTDMWVGSRRSTDQPINNPVLGVRLSSSPKTDDELADWTAPLEVDGATTYLLTFEGDLYDSTPRTLKAFAPSEMDIPVAIYGWSAYGTKTYADDAEYLEGGFQATMLPFRPSPVAFWHHYVLSAYMRSAVSRRAMITVAFLDENKEFLTASRSEPVWTSTTDWTRIWVRELVPRETHFAAIAIEILEVEEGESHWVDGVLLEEADEPLEYFDGSFEPMAHYHWDANAHASASYFYDRRLPRQNRLAQLIPEHIPMGLDFETRVGEGALAWGQDDLQAP